MPAVFASQTVEIDPQVSQVSPQISPVRMITQMAMPDIDLEESPPQSWPNRLRPNRVTRKSPRIGPEEVRLLGLSVRRDYIRSVRD